jgi:hypothetical protein
VRELFRIDGETLVPASDKAREWVAKQREEFVLVSYEKVRSKAQHDFFWASLRALWDNQPEFSEQHATVEHLKDALLIDLGRCTYHGIVVRPDSIAPGNMKEDEWQDFMRDYADWVMKGWGLTLDELRRNIPNG